MTSLVFPHEKGMYLVISIEQSNVFFVNLKCTLASEIVGNQLKNVNTKLIHGFCA